MSIVTGVAVPDGSGRFVPADVSRCSWGGLLDLVGDYSSFGLTAEALYLCSSTEPGHPHRFG